MDILLYILIFIIGTLFGSFYTLATYRIPLGKDITHEHSFCPSCNHKLGFLDLVPLLSYIFLGGKCRYCKKKIGPRYFIMELLSGVLFVLLAYSIQISVKTYWSVQIIYFILSILYITFLFLIAGIDKEKRQISKDVLLYGFILSVIYMMYLTVIDPSFSTVRYVIYLILISIILFISTYFLKKKAKNIYACDILVLCLIMSLFTYESVTILTLMMTLIAIAIQLVIDQIVYRKNKKKKETLIEKLPIGFYLCVFNILVMIFQNFVIFYT